MTYEARLSTLRHFLRHYSRCTSVSDIVVVRAGGEVARHGLKPLLPAPCTSEDFTLSLPLPALLPSGLFACCLEC